MPDSRKGLRLHLDAETDLQRSVSFYRERGGEELAARFKREVATAFTAIANTPERFASVRGFEGVQKFRLKHFPLSILYANRSDYVWVVAVAHGSRQPGFWEERLR